MTDRPFRELYELACDWSDRQRAEVIDVALRSAHAARRNPRRLPRRPVRLRHGDRYRRVSRSAPPPPLPEVPPGVLRQAGIRHAEAGGRIRRRRRSTTPPCRRRSTRCAACRRPARDYLLPFGARSRFLFKMDFAEAEYISRLRSGVKGHFSYREIAWEMKVQDGGAGARTGPADRRDAAVGGRSAEAMSRSGATAPLRSRLCRKAVQADVPD